MSQSFKGTGEFIETGSAGQFSPGFQPMLKRHDLMAKRFICIVSLVVFLAVAVLSRVKFNINLGFDPHLFAAINAWINSAVAILLLSALIAVKKHNYDLHRKLMIIAIILSILFLLSYICHHLFAGETKYGDLDHNGIISEEEKSTAGPARLIYYIILATHIPLAGIILPFILFTAYRGATGMYKEHKKLARITWPIWMYVAITGVAVYWMIRPYYN